MTLIRSTMTLLFIIGLAPVVMETRPYAEGHVATVRQDPPPLSGAHTIRQLSNGQFVDAHDTDDKDFRVVTRPPQDNATQRWIFRHVGGRTYKIQQEHTQLFLDAHDTQDRDFAVVLRPEQPDMTQHWIVTQVGTHQGFKLYAIQQVSTRQFLDGHQRQERDFGVMTRPQQAGTTQRWIVQQAAAAPTQTSDHTSETCSISGFVEGPLVKVLGPDHPGGVSESIQLRHIVAKKADGTTIRAELQSRRYVFRNLPPGVVYTVAPSSGFRSTPLSKAITCQAGIGHVANFRITP